MKNKMATRDVSWWIENLFLRRIEKWVLLLASYIFPVTTPNPFLEGYCHPVKLENSLSKNVADMGDAQSSEEKRMPQELRGGVYMRVGPNPRYMPVRNYHMFDGDGMVHSVLISDDGSRVDYSSRYCRTKKLGVEEAMGHPVFDKIADLRGVMGLFTIFITWLRRLLRVIPAAKEGQGTANTSLVYHNKALTAMHEADLPYYLNILDNGAIDTVMRRTYESPNITMASAHPKIDGRTGDMVQFSNDSYTTPETPSCKVWIEKANGLVAASQTVSLRKPIMMHDIALTQNYVIIMEHPLVFDPQKMVTENRIPFMWSPQVGSRYGVLRRTADGSLQPGSAIKWFECTNPHFVFHVANAWEVDPTTIVLIICRYDNFDLEAFSEEFKAKKKDLMPKLGRIQLSVATGEYLEEEVLKGNQGSELFAEFPTVPPSLVGRRTRYTYCAVVDPNSTEAGSMSSCAKVDLDKGTVCGKIDFDGTGGECVFVPRKTQAAADGSNEEDDGYLLTYVTKKNSTANGDATTKFAVYDAKTMSATPVCQTSLRSMVPYGFHTLFVDKEQKASLQQRANELRGASR